VDADGEKTSYAELDALANRFARKFRACGVLPGDRIGIYLPRSARAIAAMIGALRVGGVYVPLDPESPPSRTGLAANDCSMRHVVITPSLLSTWIAAGQGRGIEHFFLAAADAHAMAAGSARVHPWAEVLATSGAPSPTHLDSRRSPDDLAYVLYTSGSTGAPKGVMLSHRNATAFVDWAADQIALSEADHVASVAPFHFDLAVFDVWASLARGATIVVVDEATVQSARRMLDRIHSASITVWYSVPSALILMLEAVRPGGEKDGLAERGAPTLRAVLFAGEVFPLKHLRAAMAALPRARFWNLFGPTETNVCTAYEVPWPPPEEGAIPIGTASCGGVATIVDTEGRPVADGETGELFIDGPTVMLGYWDGGRCTPAKRPYPTGDLVSRRPDGALMYHGRRDHMVKVRGFRVELGEVEATLHLHPNVNEAVVLLLGQTLVAVLVPSDPQLSVLEVKRHCAARLPKYMIPADVRFVSSIPRTSSGKADRARTARALAEKDASVLSPVQRQRVQKEP
jgi:amino acid adenylation domain-containing protein